MEDEHIAKLIRKFSSDDVELRRAARSAIAEIGLPAVPALLKALESRDSLTRYYAANALETIGTPALGPLIECLENKNTMVQFYAAFALGGIADERALEALLAEAAKEDHERRLCGIIGLGRRKEDRAIYALIAALQDSEYLVRNRAAHTLKKMQGALAIYALVQELNQESELVRRRATQILIAAVKSRQFLYNVLLEKRLTKQQRVETLETVRKTSIYYFPDTTTLCTEVMQKWKDTGYREEAADVLAWIKNRDELLRAGPFETGVDGKDLLRAVDGSTGDTRPETLLHPADEVSPAFVPPQKKSLRARLQSLLRRNRAGR